MVRIRTHANPHQVRAPEPHDWGAEFGRAAPLLLEIGSGRGDFLLGLARAYPDRDVLGLEIRRALVEHIGERARSLGLSNCAAVLADATRHLPILLLPASVEAVFVLFPDPWHKKKHLKRRVMRPALLEGLASVLRPGGTVDFQTDRLELAEEADEVVTADPRFVNLLGRGELEGEEIPDCGSRRCRMHRERGAAIYKMRFGLADSPAPAPGAQERDRWLGFETVPPVVEA